MKNFKIFIFFSAVIFFTACKDQPNNQDTLEKVRFGALPYGDHSIVVIGAEKGWFKDVGIEIDYKPVKIDAVVPLLKNGSEDVISVPPGILFSSYDNAPDLCSFVFSDLFQGYAILAKKGKYQSVEQFIAKGQSYKQAIISAMQQLKGRTFTYPSETAIKPFINQVMIEGNIKRSDFNSLVLDDPLTVNAMRAGRADFQVGGVPSRIILQKEGYVPIISSITIAKDAVPSDTSQVLASILQNGWATTKQYYKKHHNTILKLASVNYRIMDYINHDPDSAAAIHMPYLSKITGQKFTIKDAQVMYSDLDPFYTFEKQNTWFHDKSNPLYYAYVNGSILNSFKAQNLYKKNTPTVDDVIYADDIYKELEGLKISCDKILAKIRTESLNPESQQLLKKGKYYYSIYDFLDAEIVLKKLSK